MVWQEIANITDNVDREMIIVMSEKLDKESIALDFDGVLHSYKSGWTGYTPTDSPVTGAQEFVEELHKLGYEVVIFSVRAKTKAGKAGIQGWLKKHEFPALKVCYGKPEAILYIDDRGFRFDGKFDKALDFIKKDKLSSWCK